MDEEEYLPLSALQHMAFCPRQCALIHLEGVWSENRCTSEGRLFHERAHEGGREWREGVLIVRGLRLVSRRLGFSGVADVVEFHPHPAGCTVPGLEGHWQPIPVEYKVGKPKKHDADRVQLCGQVFCLEDMFGSPIPHAWFYYGKPRRRLDVEIDAALRERTAGLIHAVRTMLESGMTPSPCFEAKCEMCSLRDACLPEATRSVRRYIQRNVREAHREARADSCPDGSPDGKVPP